MPIPKPENNETENEFIQRCITDNTMQDEYPDEDQRLAVCYQSWDNNKKEETQMEKRIKYFSNAAKNVDEDKRILRFIGSTEEVDRDNEVIKSSGWKLSNYKKNPVVLVNHQHQELPVAKTNKVWVEDKKLMFDIEFPDSSVHPQGDTLYKLYKNGYMNSTSVGFLPNMKKAEFGEKENDPSITFNEQELLEISLVSVPANPQALITSKNMKKAIKDEVIDELELKDLKEFLQLAVEESENTEKKDKKSEKNEEKEENSQKTENIIKNEDKHININKVCEECGCEIHLCSSCFEKKEQEEFFKKVYEALLEK